MKYKDAFATVRHQEAQIDHGVAGAITAADDGVLHECGLRSAGSRAWTPTHRNSTALPSTRMVTSSQPASASIVAAVCSAGWMRMHALDNAVRQVLEDLAAEDPRQQRAPVDAEKWMIVSPAA
jgi:hypothetical protein